MWWEQLADLGVLEVTLIGGEVYLRDDWLEIVAAIRRRSMECTIVTGGRGFTRDPRASCERRRRHERVGCLWTAWLHPTTRFGA